MTLEELQKVEDIVAKRGGLWKEFRLAYENGEDFIKSALDQHEYETSTNYQKRLKNAFSYGMSTMVVDTLAFFVEQSTPSYDLGNLNEDPRFTLFLSNSTYRNHTFEELAKQILKLGSVYGSLGILIDMPNVGTISLQETLAQKIYPYAIVYKPENVLEMKYERDANTGVPILQYVKLREEDNSYLIWYADHWDRYIIPEHAALKDTIPPTDSGPNPLGIIPFVYHINEIDALNPQYGVSDLSVAYRIEKQMVSILSLLSEIIANASFPIWKHVMRESYNRNQRDDDGRVVIPVLKSGVVAIDKDSSSEPGWISSPVGEPVSAGLSFLAEISSNALDSKDLGAISTTQGTNGANTEASLTYKFKSLEARICDKATRLDATLTAIIRLFALWIDSSVMPEEIQVSRKINFGYDIDSDSLENLILARPFFQAVSNKASSQSLIKMARILFKDAPKETLAEIEAEITSSSEKLRTSSSLTDESTTMASTQKEMR